MQGGLFRRGALGRNARPFLLGSSSALPARSALEIRRTRGANRGSGLYWLDKGSGPYQAWCDMETDGGGWEKVDCMSSTQQKAGSSCAKGSYSILDPTSAFRITGAVDATGSYVSDLNPLPFAHDYMFKSQLIQQGGGGSGSNHNVCLRIDQAMNAYNTYSALFDNVSTFVTWSLNECGISILSRTDNTSRRYRVGAQWSLDRFEARPVYGSGWNSQPTGTIGSQPNNQNVHVGFSTWADASPVWLVDHSVWIRGG